MRYGIRRRTVLLAPPRHPDLIWILGQFRREEIWRSFGHEGSVDRYMYMRFMATRIAAWTIELPGASRRIGFALAFGPEQGEGEWEIALAILDPRDRNAFHAMNACCALCHYLFDHRAATGLRWRIRVDNRASRALVRRMVGARAERELLPDGSARMYRVSLADWVSRSGRLGGAFECIPFPEAPPLGMDGQSRPEGDRPCGYVTPAIVEVAG